MSDLPCLVVGYSIVVYDPALQPGARGARKHVVTDLYEKKEVVATDTLWRPPLDETERCQVMVAENWEMATFNEVALQDRHSHRQGTEIYMVLEGTMKIEVGGESHILSENDAIIVNPGAVRKVIPHEDLKFLAQVITVNCGGADDKFVVE